MVVNKIEEIIDEARNGRMYILVDNPNRENEGDLIIPAQMVTPEGLSPAIVEISTAASV